MSGVTAMRTQKIKEIMSRQIATIIKITEIAKTEITVTITGDPTMRSTETQKVEMRKDVATDTTSVMKTQTTNPTASLWRTMKRSQVQKLSLQSLKTKDINSTRLTLVW
jgi:Asp-tRNA(Asn)/Glu-tRNA(Gln) amidotransferase C subunit